MGTPTPWPPPYSENNCDYCTPYLFPPGQTPRRVKMAVWGVKACPDAPHPAPNGLFVLTQLELYHCTWRLITGDYTFFWITRYGASACKITSPPTYGWYFYHDPAPLCETLFNNEFTDCTPYGALGHSGEVLIYWP